MKTSQFGRIMLVCSLLIIALNGLFYWQSFKVLLQQQQIAILIGLCFYAIQVTAIYLLLGKHRAWLVQPFQGKQMLSAMTAMIVVQLLTLWLITGLTGQSRAPSWPSQFTAFLPVFLLNSLPGALLEEWVFRYLPFRFGQQTNKRYRPILLCVGALVLFTLIHIPAYLFQYDLSLTQLGRVLATGLFFLVVYWLTRSVVFTALFHGWTNNPFYLVESPYYWLYFYVSVAVVSSIWAGLNWRSQRNAIAA